jgi:hypothetical protein
MWVIIPTRPGERLLFGALCAIFLAIMLGSLLTTVLLTVRPGELIIELWPHRDCKVLRANQVRGVSVGTFNPLTDYDGWGVLRGLRPTEALHLANRQGVWLDRTEGGPLFLPSRRAHDLAKAIQEYVARPHNNQMQRTGAAQAMHARR